MRWIQCACCDRGHAVCVVFESTHICDDCRLRVVDYWMGVLGFTLAAHPFIDEFMGVETNQKRRVRLESYEPKDLLSMYSDDDDSKMNLDNSLDILDGLC